MFLHYSNRYSYFSWFGSITVTEGKNMSTVKVYENPQWLQDAVAERVPGRRCLGAFTQDYANFMRQMSVRAVQFGDDEPKEQSGSKVIIDIDKKEYRNESETEDEVQITGQKSESKNCRKNYQLAVGKSKYKTVIVGGSVGLNASFFNIGGLGISLNSSTSHSKEMTEQQYGEEKTNALSKEYSMKVTVKIPPRTKLSVTVTTYLVTYLAQEIEVEIKAPSTALLPVTLGTRFGPIFERRFVFVTAEDFLRSLADDDDIKIIDGTCRTTTRSYLTYLGEKTTVCKRAKQLDF